MQYSNCSVRFIFKVTEPFFLPLPTARCPLSNYKTGEIDVALRFLSFDLPGQAPVTSCLFEVWYETVEYLLTTHVALIPLLVDNKGLQIEIGQSRNIRFYGTYPNYCYLNG